MQHLVSIADLSAIDIWRLIELAANLKDEWKAGGNKPLLGGKTLGMIFQKPSLRTRVSFEMGMAHLGGRAMYLSPQEVQLGQRESVADVARVLSRYVHGIMARVFAHADVEALAMYATVPVINGLSDLAHPCQALSDLFTIYERRGAIEGLTLAYVGDGNNVANSLLLACSKLGMEIRVATPPGYEPDAQIVSDARRWAREADGKVVVDMDAQSAVRGADVIYTDVWTSMGQETERETRLPAFRPYQINQDLLRLAKPNAVVMHCLPAHRGEEITDEVIDGPQSIVFDQAENRMHLQKAILVSLMADATRLGDALSAPG